MLESIVSEDEPSDPEEDIDMEVSIDCKAHGGWVEPLVNDLNVSEWTWKNIVMSIASYDNEHADHLDTIK